MSIFTLDHLTFLALGFCLGIAWCFYTLGGWPKNGDWS